MIIDRRFDCFDSEINGGEKCVCHNETKSAHANGEEKPCPTGSELFGQVNKPLWSISHGENELGSD